MKNSLRGVLWSALVFPGSGQIALKHTGRSVLFAAFAAVCIIIMVVVAVVQTWNGLEDLALQGCEIGFAAVADSALSSLKAVRNFILPPLLLCWFLSAVDAWRLGKE